MPVFTAACLVGLLTTVVPTGQAATLNEGDLDPSFGVAGTAPTPVGPGKAGGMAQQADGKLVVATYREHGTGIALIRYTRNGAIDTGFGDEGVAAIPDDAYPPEADAPTAAPTDVAIDADGRIVVVGPVNVTGAVPSDFIDIVVARFTSAGVLDTEFGGGDGVLFENLDDRGETPDAVVIRADNRIVIVGDVTNATGWDSFALQLTEDGTRDSAFDGDGYLLSNDKPTLDNMDNVFWFGAALGPGGTVNMVGSTLYGGQAEMLLVRLTSAGVYDTSFDNDGIRRLNSVNGNEQLKAVLVRKDGSMLAAGYRTGTSFTHAVVIRVKPGGGLDTGFGGDGFADVEGLSGAQDLALQRDGKIVIAGITAADYDAYVARFRPAGSLDPNFGSNGIQVVQSDEDGEAWAVVVQRAGRIVTAGGLGAEPLVQGFVGDATPPGKARIRGAHRWLTTKATLKWHATDDNTGVKSYAVQRRAAAYTKAKYGAWKLWKSGTATSAAFAGQPGNTYCFRARARDYAGNVGAYPAPRCTAVPLDERKLSRQGAWAASSGAGFYLGTALTASAKGTSLTLGGARWRHLAVVATTCPACGQLDVYLGTKLLRTLDLSAPLRHGKVMSVAGRTKAQSGDIRLVVHSSGHPVTIEGLGVSLA